MITWLRQHRALGIANGLWMGAGLWLIIFLLIAHARGAEAPGPDAPSVARRGHGTAVVETYAPDQRMIVHNWPTRAMVRPGERLLDWSFILGHGIYAGASAFDAWETQRNLGTCAFEGNDDLGRTPTPRAQAIHGMVEFAAVVGGDLLLKWIGRRQGGLPRWLNMLGGNGAAIYGAIGHTRAGIEWVRLCH